MKYDIEIEKSALKNLKRIPAKERNKVITTIEQLANNPRPTNAKKLIARDGWRIRVGRHRVIYEIKDQICYILVLDIGHRKEIYR